MKEETVSALVRALYPLAKHPQRTAECPPLTAFQRIVENGWPAAEIEHMRRGCVYCEKMLVVQLGEEPEHPKPQSLVSVLCMLERTQALKTHIELDDCRLCRDLCHSEFVRRRMARWREQPQVASSYARAVFGQVRRLRQAVAGSPQNFSTEHISDDGKLVAEIWRQRSKCGSNELRARVLNPDKEYRGRAVLLELIPPHGAPFREPIMLDTDTPAGAEGLGWIGLWPDWERRLTNGDMLECKLVASLSDE
jgi:hypothetical protein